MGGPRPDALNMQVSSSAAEYSQEKSCRHEMGLAIASVRNRNGAVKTRQMSYVA